MIRGDWYVIMHFIWMNKLEKSCLVFTICIYCIQIQKLHLTTQYVCIFGVAETVLQYNRICILLIAVE